MYACILLFLVSCSLYFSTDHSENVHGCIDVRVSLVCRENTRVTENDAGTIYF